MAGVVVAKSRDKDLNKIQSSATEITAVIQTQSVKRLARGACIWLVVASSTGSVLLGSG